MDIQTPAEKFLIAEIVKTVDGAPNTAVLLNVGAGKSVLIEETVAKRAKKSFVCDRFDVVDCRVQHPAVRRCFVASVENIVGAAIGEYDAAFANYVLEHVENVEAAAKEIWRVLKPGGKFILSLPNPAAPEFRISKLTPRWFHQAVKGKGVAQHAHETQYAYKNIPELVGIFERAGFKTLEIKYFPFTYGYLYRFPIINFLSRGYDALVRWFGVKSLMGNVGVEFEK